MTRPHEPPTVPDTASCAAAAGVLRRGAYGLEVAAAALPCEQDALAVQARRVAARVDLVGRALSEFAQDTAQLAQDAAAAAAAGDARPRDPQAALAMQSVHGRVGQARAALMRRLRQAREQ